MLKSGLVFVCEPSGVLLPLSEFVSKYSVAYCKNNATIDGICYRQTNDVIEKRVLTEELSDYASFARKMAWKIGKIKFSGNSDEIVYYRDWADCEKNNPQVYGHCINLKGAYDDLDFSSINELCKKGDRTQALGEIINCKTDRIGPVYSIAELFFISNGKYPIYDRFAHMALKCIFSEDERFPKTGDSARLLNIDVIKIYDEYVEQIECLMKKLGKENSNYIEYRDLDRALWVYGHGFSDKCLKKHIGYKHI